MYLKARKTAADFYYYDKHKAFNRLDLFARMAPLASQSKLNHNNLKELATQFLPFYWVLKHFSSFTVKISYNIKMYHDSNF